MITNELRRISNCIIASLPEKEVEKLLKDFLKGTIFANKAFAVGGYNRDELLGKEAKDLDIVVEMKDGAEKLTHLLSKTFYPAITKPHQMGASYPIWQITFKDNINYLDKVYNTHGAVIEFADTMKESFPDENSRQRITEPGTLKDDVERRDFTVNSLMKDLTTGEFVDLTGTSINDIHKGILRGNPGVDFDVILKRDPLRMIRLIRFQAKYDWEIPLSVLKAVKRNASRIQIVSSERIMGELTKLMEIGKLYKAIKMMKVVDLLKYVLPEIQALKGVEQPIEYHQEGAIITCENFEPK